MIWGGADEIEKKKFGGPSLEKKLEAFLQKKGLPQEKKLERLLWGKNKIIFEFASAPPDH